MLSYLTMKFEFLPLFVIGLVLSKHWRQFVVIKLAHPFKLFLLFILTILLLGNRFIFSFDYTAHTQSLITAFGTALLIPLAIWGRTINKALKHPGVDFLGKISYSFYLYHFPILLVTVSLLYPVFESLLIPAIISLFLTIIVSFISFRFIESKSMLSYRNLAGWIALRQQA